MKPKISPKLDSGVVDIGRGEIKDNYFQAIVTSRVFRSKVEKAKKGKGSYTRNSKHRGKESFAKLV